jgi:formiminotetrahydrofolate cyclodeaminase
MLTAAFITIIVNLGEVKEEGKKKDERKKNHALRNECYSCPFTAHTETKKQ